MNFVVFAVSCAVAGGATRALMSLLQKRGLLDVPNGRSSHKRPTPRGGGLGIILGVTCGVLVARVLGLPLPDSVIFACALSIAAVGFLDDRSGGLPARLRFSLQCAAAAIIAYHTGGIERLPLPEPMDVPLGVFSIPAAMIWIVAVTNIYNFLDGIDGYAGLQGVIAGVGIALLSQNGSVSVVGLAVAGSCAGFLMLNWHPAKIFMGDVGSGALGFLLAALPLQLDSTVRSDAVFIVSMCLWFFLADGTFTIISRLARGEKIWEAHCSHLYQRLVKTGLPHNVVVTRVGTAAAVLAALSLVGVKAGRSSWQWLVLGSAIGGFLFLLRWTLHRESGFNKGGEMFTVEKDQQKISLHLGRRRMRVKQLHLVLDLTVLALSFALAYLLRFDFAVPGKELLDGLVQLPFVVLIQFAALFLMGGYALIWRYIGMSEMKVFVRAAAVSMLPLLILRFVLPNQLQMWRVPLSVILTDTMLAFGGVMGLRVLRRVIYERYEKRRRAIHTGNSRKAVLLIGAGRAGVRTAREINSSGDLELEVKGFVDDDSEKQGSVINGVKVFGTTRDIPHLVKELNIDHVIISLSRASRSQFRRVLDICEAIPVKVRIIPGLSEILGGRVSLTRIRDVQIEDVLGREPVHLDEDIVASFLTNKTVMVTGAGGSIGSELARQVAQFQPANLLLIERAEFALFNIDRDLRALFPELSIETLVADVGDEARMRSIFETHGPQVVLHAAAHKHVPMMESNPCEAIKNNVLATRLLGELAGEFEAEAFVLISTDKAVRPTSVMGAAKRVAELAIQELNQSTTTRFVAVRFGNVIGSAGSVLPIFKEQIRKGGPVTITHPEMTRYFMTIPEAAQLVLQSGAMGKGGEIFILDMGEPVRILDMAKETIMLSGLRPYEDIDIIFTGIRAGEKLYEELEMTDEQMTKTRHPKIFIGKIGAYPEEHVYHALQRLAVLTRHERETEIRSFLNELLPEARVSVPAGATVKVQESLLHLAQRMPRAV